MPGARRNRQPCCQESLPSRLFRHTQPVAMSRSFSAPSGSRRRRRCVGTGRRRLARSLQPRRYWPCSPPGSWPCFRASTRPSRSRWRESRRRRRRRPVGAALAILPDTKPRFAEDSPPNRGGRIPPLLSIGRQIWHRGASPRPCLRSIEPSVVHPAHAAAGHGGRRVLLRCFGETLGTPLAQAKLIVPEHYLTEVRLG
jgi:hypothetical protein